MGNILKKETFLTSFGTSSCADETFVAFHFLPPLGKQDKFHADTREIVRRCFAAGAK
jgi:hypothetical protein